MSFIDRYYKALSNRFAYPVFMRVRLPLLNSIHCHITQNNQKYLSAVKNYVTFALQVRRFFGALDFWKFYVQRSSYAKFGAFVKCVTISAKLD